jgi:hypothetical protein
MTQLELTITQITQFVDSKPATPRLHLILVASRCHDNHCRESTPVPAVVTDELTPSA